MTLVGQAQQTLFVSPVNGTSPIDAAEVLANDEALRAKHNTHDNDATIHIQSSVAGSRPSAGVAGRVWLSTDTLVLGYDNGVSWSALAYAASSHAHAWADITSGKPTTLAGYGITDAVTSVNPTTSGTWAHTGGGGSVAGGKLTLAATAAGYASLNLPHGTAPSSPSNGDVWTTSAGGMFWRTNGVTQTPVVKDTNNQIVNDASQTFFQGLASATVGGGVVNTVLSWGTTTNFGESVWSAGNPTRIDLPATGFYLITLLMESSAPAAGDYATFTGSSGAPFAWPRASAPQWINFGDATGANQTKSWTAIVQPSAPYFEVTITTLGAQTFYAQLLIRRLV